MNDRKPANAIQIDANDTNTDARGMTFRQCYGKYQPRKTCRDCQKESKGW